MPVQWNALNNMPNPGVAFTQSFGAARDRKQKDDLLHMEMQEKRAKLQKEQRIGQLAAAAAQGDSRAIVGLWADDPDLAFKLDKRVADKAAEGFKFIGQAAYDIVQRPEHERPALWDQYIERGVQMGYQDLAQYRGRYDPVALNSLVAKADGMKDFMGFQQPDYVPDRGYGFQGFQFGRPIEGGNVQQQMTPGAVVPDPRRQGGSGGNAGGGFLDGIDPLAPL